MKNFIVYANVKASGVLGKILPKITVEMPQYVLRGIIKAAVKTAIREEIDPRFLKDYDSHK